jgi:hypothetical protein
MMRLLSTVAIASLGLAIGCGFSLGSDDPNGDLGKPRLRRAEDDSTAAPNADAGPPVAAEPPMTTSVPIDAGRPPEPEPKPLHVFVSSTTMTGNLGGVEGADARCNMLAQGAGLKGKYYAWLSTAGVNALDRTKGDGPWVLVDESHVTDAKREFGEGLIDYPIQKDEKGNAVPAGETHVWTGTGPDGKFGNADCNGWTDTNGNGVVGEAKSMAVNGWLAIGNDPCAAENRIYCFEEP